jgi:putative SOS response-associated peptidase YedK
LQRPQTSAPDPKRPRRCRLSFDYSEIKIKLKFDLAAPAPNFERDWNLPPTRPMLVAIRSQDGKRLPMMMRWGLLPSSEI